MIAKFATPFYPERFIRGNSNLLRNRINLTFYEIIINSIAQALRIEFMKSLSSDMLPVKTKKGRHPSERWDVLPRQLLQQPYFYRQFALLKLQS